jgi:cation:H+ antiporter
MIVSILMMVAGLVLVALGAEGLVRGSSSAALKLGVAPIAVGLILVAATGSPEMIVALTAALEGSSELAAGTVIGSNISNVLLILGFAALLRPMKVRTRVLHREVPLMIGVTGLFALLVLDGEISRLDGGVLVVAGVAYLISSYRIAKVPSETKQLVQEMSEELTPSKRRWWKEVVLIVFGFAALLFGAEVLVNGAMLFAKEFDISEAVIGLSIIAIGTSLPELATSASASLRGEPDIAFGNAIGANVINILIVIGVTALILPIKVDGIEPLDFAMVLGSALLLFVFLGTKYFLSRWEGLFFLIIYSLYLLHLAGGS